MSYYLILICILLCLDISVVHCDGPVRDIEKKIDSLGILRNLQCLQDDHLCSLNYSECQTEIILKALEKGYQETEWIEIISYFSSYFTSQCHGRQRRRIPKRTWFNKNKGIGGHRPPTSRHDPKQTTPRPDFSDVPRPSTNRNNPNGGEGNLPPCPGGICPIPPYQEYPPNSVLEAIPLVDGVIPGSGPHPPPNKDVDQRNVAPSSPGPQHPRNSGHQLSLSVVDLLSVALLFQILLSTAI